MRTKLAGKKNARLTTSIYISHTPRCHTNTHLFAQDLWHTFRRTVIRIGIKPTQRHCLI